MRKRKSRRRGSRRNQERGARGREGGRAKRRKKRKSGPKRKRREEENEDKRGEEEKREDQGGKKKTTHQSHKKHQWRSSTSPKFSIRQDHLRFLRSLARDSPMRERECRCVCVGVVSECVQHGEENRIGSSFLRSVKKSCVCACDKGKTKGSGETKAERRSCGCE